MGQSRCDPSSVGGFKSQSGEVLGLPRHEYEFQTEAPAPLQSVPDEPFADALFLLCGKHRNRREKGAGLSAHERMAIEGVTDEFTLFIRHNGEVGYEIGRSTQSRHHFGVRVVVEGQAEYVCADRYLGFFFRSDDYVSHAVVFRKIGFYLFWAKTRRNTKALKNRGVPMAEAHRKMSARLITAKNRNR